MKGPDFSGAASLEEELTHRMTYLFHVWRDTPAGKVFTGLLIEMQSTPEAIERFRTEALIPRRIESTKIFERAKIRGEIDLETKISALLDLLYGWSWYRLLTGNLACDDDFNSTIRLIARAGRGE
ncbi:TPA: TetR-like C-terminal domain-containing protein [Klebsiella pneumoniae]|uniref:TetR-like C-terminal domain-containing protein n=1 Tax=Klebsiella pneumoniae TaxID=573 RepID=UPI002F969506